MTNSGNLVDQVPVGLGVRSMTYIPTTKQFAGANPGNLTTLLFFARNGTLVNSIDLSPTGIDEIFAITFFNSGRTPGGEFLLLSSPVTHQGFVIDSAGTVLKQLTTRQPSGL